MGPSRHVLPLTLAGVALGILVADSAAPAVPVVPVALAGMVVAAAGILVGRRGSFVVLLGVATIAFAAGTWRGSAIAAGTTGASVAVLADGAEHDLSGTVLDDPRPREDRLQLVLGKLRVERDEGSAALSDRLLVWLPRGLDASAGDRLRLRSEMEIPEDFEGFAYREYLERQGIGAVAYARTAEVAAEANGPAAILAGIRSALLGGLNGIVPEPEAALGAGILLGVRASIAPEINDAFARAGLTHVVAISGWNIALVAALVTAAASPLSRRPGGRWTTAAVAATTVGGYVLLTGASPSVVRAALMAAAMLIAKLGGSRAHAASALALAALLMLLAAPPVLWDVGFQLSLLATAGLVWFGGAVERRLPGWPGWISEPIALTLAAQLTTLPVILVNFERLSLVAPIANVLVVPFVPVAMLFSALAALAGLLDGGLSVPIVGPAITWLAGGAAWLCLRLIMELGSAASSVPLAAVDVQVPAPLAVAWLPMLGLVAWAVGPSNAPLETQPARSPGRLATVAGRVLRPVPVAAGLVAVLLTVTIASLPDGRLHVTVLDIGQGDAILVEAPSGATMLVDGGPDPELTLRRLGVNLPFFARRIDVMVVSHPHQDHVAGLVEVLGRFEVRTLLHAGIPFENQAFDHLVADAFWEHGLVLGLARAGRVFALDPTTSVEVLYPTDADATAPLPEGDINNGSIVVLLRHGGFTALLTGDAEAPVESSLVTRGRFPAVDLLKVGHHGSTSSTTPALLAATRPTIAAISAGEGNEYGHPAPETLAALAGVATFRTDLHGDIEVISDGRTVQVRTDEGWSAPVPVQRGGAATSIAGWASPTDQPHGSCSTECRPGSSSTPPAWPAWPSLLPASWRRRRSRSTGPWSRRRRCSTTSTRSRSAERAACMASSAPGAWRRWATVSSPCRSPPIRSTRSSTTIAFPSAGPRSSSR